MTPLVRLCMSELLNKAFVKVFTKENGTGISDIRGHFRKRKLKQCQLQVALTLMICIVIGRYDICQGCGYSIVACRDSRMHFKSCATIRLDYLLLLFLLLPRMRLSSNLVNFYSTAVSYHTHALPVLPSPLDLSDKVITGCAVAPALC